MRAVAVAAALVLAASVASAQVSIGVTGSKTCPPGPFAPGDPVTCTFSFTNNSTNAIVFDTLTDTFPCVNNHIVGGRVVCDAGSGSPAAVQCLQGVTPVTGLAAGGSGAAASCTGTVVETAPTVTCGGVDAVIFHDRVSLDFHDSVMPALTNFNDSTSQFGVTPPACGGTGRITGGGSIFTKGGLRVTHGFELHCDIEDAPNNLEVNWGGNHFHMETLLSATCTDDPNIDQHPPASAPFDTYVGTGVGSCNGVPGALISFTFVDGGEPGWKNDTGKIVITGCPAPVNGVSVDGPLKKGNHQTHQ